MKKHLNVILFFLVTSIHAIAQELPILKPHLWNENIYTEAHHQFWEHGADHLKGIDYINLSEQDQALLDSLETYGPYTDYGCSWYCGGGPNKVNATSYLETKNDKTYKPENAHDFNLLTAWIPKNAIGEKISFYFKPFDPRVNAIHIYNGYIKYIDLWKKNARVAKFKLWINNKPIAILALEDVTNLQEFKIDPVRSEDTLQDLIITLEILEIYPGNKYNDVAISEINFDGLDVHCFAAGTKISMANGTTKPIENVNLNDTVLTYNWQTQKPERSIVTNNISTNHCNLYTIAFADREIRTTNDHPFWTKNKGWASLNPDKSNTDYRQDTMVKKLELGDEIFMPLLNQYVPVITITPYANKQLTYTLELESGNSFIANGLLVKTELPIPIN